MAKLPISLAVEEERERKRKAEEEKRKQLEEEERLLLLERRRKEAEKEEIERMNKLKELEEKQKSFNQPPTISHTVPYGASSSTGYKNKMESNEKSNIRGKQVKSKTHITFSIYFFSIFLTFFFFLIIFNRFNLFFSCI